MVFCDLYPLDTEPLNRLSQSPLKMGSKTAKFQHRFQARRSGSGLRRWQDSAGPPALSHPLSAVHEAGESASWRENVAEGNCPAVPGRCYSCESAVDRPILQQFFAETPTDQVYLLERGEVKAQGTFEELTRANERFREMASA